MKVQKIISVGAFFLIFAVSSCFSPWKDNTAKFTLVLGDSVSASRTARHTHPNPDMLAELEHSVELSNGSDRVTLYAAKGQQTIEAVVAAGKWDISVSTFLDDDLYATGSTTANLQPGQNNVVSITMSMAMIMVPGQFLSDKFGWLEGNAVDGGKYLINVNKEEELNPTQLPYDPNVTIKLVGASGGSSIFLGGNGSMFTVGSGVKLILGNNITLIGISDNFFPNNAPLVRVEVDGTLEMLSGSKITDNSNKTTNPSNCGGGVYVAGTFIMHGGEISGNSLNGSSINAICGGGVYVADGGIFTMNGGTINGNTCNSSGGGVNLGNSSTDKATFIMNGGEIFGNASTSGAGGGVNLSGITTFYMTGGTIYGSNAEEVFRNKAPPNETPSRGAALCSAGTAYAQYGTFTTPGDITTWEKAGDLLGGIDDTIKVVNGYKYP